MQIEHRMSASRVVIRESFSVEDFRIRINSQISMNRLNRNENVLTLSYGCFRS